MVVSASPVSGVNRARENRPRAVVNDGYSAGRIDAERKDFAVVALIITLFDDRGPDQQFTDLVELGRIRDEVGPLITAVVVNLQVEVLDHGITCTEYRQIAQDKVILTFDND